MSRGGKREGAGRKKLPWNKRAVTVTVTLPPLKASVAQLLGGSTAKTPSLRAIRRGILLALEHPVVMIPGH